MLKCDTVKAYQINRYSINRRINTMENKTIINEAIANMASTSAALERFCHDPKNYNSFGAQLLENMSRELCKQANDLKEIQYMYGV